MTRMFRLAAAALAAAALSLPAFADNPVRLTVNGQPVPVSPDVGNSLRININGDSVRVTAEAPADKAPKAAPKDYSRIRSAAAQALLDDGALLLDVRSAKEYNARHAAGAELMPLEVLETELPKRFPDRERTLVFYCRSGRRSGMALKQARKLGYTRLYNLGGLATDWKGRTVPEK